MKWETKTPENSPRLMTLAYSDYYPYKYLVGCYTDNEFRNQYGNKLKTPAFWSYIEGPGEEPPSIDVHVALRSKDYTHANDFDLRIYHGQDSNQNDCLVVQKDDTIITYIYDVDLKSNTDLMYILYRAITSYGSRYQATDDLKDRPYEHTTQVGCNLGNLKEFIGRHPDLPDTTPVFVERIQDAYFLNNHWATLRIRSHEAQGEEDHQAEYFRVYCPMLEKDHRGNPIIALDNHF